MGYEVHLDESNVALKKEHLDAAYQAMCKLNERDDLKRGGGYTGGAKVSSWFSWMDPNFPETCSDAKAVLQMLGFWVSERPNGDLWISGYDSKTGQEELFLQSIAKYVDIVDTYIDRDIVSGNKLEPFMTFTGEDGEQYMYTFKDGKLYSAAGIRKWGTPVQVESI